jgi:hypothetical protein
LKQRDIDVVAHVRDSMADASEMKGDPGTLARSEITFDKSHHFVVLKYVFLCGSRCNSPAILVLEKAGPQWTTQNRRPRSFANESRQSAEVAYKNDRETGHQRTRDPVLS